MQTTEYKGIEVCEHQINVNFCQKCKDAPKRAPKLSLGRSMWLKIQEVLADHQWHSTKDIAERTGLLEGDAYADIGRTIRKFRDEDHVPVDSRKIDPRVGEYRLTQPEEAEEFWARHEAEKIKQRTAVVESLGSDVLAALRKENAELRDELDFHRQYAASLEADIKALKEKAPPVPAVIKSSVQVSAA